MAESYLDRLLGENERIILTARQHWFLLFSTIFMEIVLMLAIVALGIFVFLWKPDVWILTLLGGLLLFLVPLISMIRDILVWANREFIVTNRRVMQISGIVNKSVTDSSLEKVNDVKLDQSFLGRMFDYGDIEILTASELGANQFRRIGKPIKFKTAMLNAKERLEQETYRPVAGDVVRPADIPTMITGLDQLRQQGILSEEEFQAKKADLLSKM